MLLELRTFLCHHTLETVETVDAGELACSGSCRGRGLSGWQKLVVCESAEAAVVGAAFLASVVPVSSVSNRTGTSMAELWRAMETYDAWLQ